jgi:lipoyl(octanoyl) transferase
MTASYDVLKTLSVYHAAHRDATADLAFESALLDAGRLSLFTYEWSRPVLVLGRGQRTDSVHIDVCNAEGIAVCKRESGGTGVLHNHTLNIGIFLPVAHPFASGIRPLYARFTTLVRNALQHAGVETCLRDPRVEPKERTPICFASHTDDTLLENGRKVFGSAQRRLRHAVLIHGALVLGLDPRQQGRVFGVSRQHIEALMAALSSPLDLSEFRDALTRLLSTRLHTDALIYNALA